MRSRLGFTLLEVMVATTIMGIAVVTLLSALSTSVRNATRLTDYDRAVLLGRAQMDSLLADPALPQLTVLGDRRAVPGHGGPGRARWRPYRARPRRLRLHPQLRRPGRRPVRRRLGGARVYLQGVQPEVERRLERHS